MLLQAVEFFGAVTFGICLINALTGAFSCYLDQNAGIQNALNRSILRLKEWGATFIHILATFGHEWKLELPGKT